MKIYITSSTFAIVLFHFLFFTPQCINGKILPEGNFNVMDYKSLAVWALGESTGASSICIARHMMGLDTDGSYPHDGGDFGRCEKLMDTVPGVRERLPEMASVNRYWAALVPRWEEIRVSKDKYALIQSIIRPEEDRDPKIVRLGDGLSLHFDV